MSFGLRKVMTLEYVTHTTRYGAMVYTDQLPTGQFFTELPKEKQEQTEMSEMRFVTLFISTVESFGDEHPAHEILWNLVEEKGVISCDCETYKWDVLKPIFAKTDEWGEFVRTRN